MEGDSSWRSFVTDAEVGDRGSDIGDGVVGCSDGCGDGYGGDCGDRCSECSGDGFDDGCGEESGALDNDGSMGDDDFAVGDGPALRIFSTFTTPKP